MMDPHEDSEELRKEAPTLFGIDRTDPFEVPEGFFDRFPHDMQEQVKSVRTGVSIPFWRGVLIAAPLVLVIIAVSGILITMTNNSELRNQQFQVMEIEDVLNFEDAEDLLLALESDDLPEELSTELSDDLLIELDFDPDLGTIEEEI